MTIRPQGYDIDVLGIVSNIVYVRWLEDLRMKMLELYWPVEKQMEDGYLPIITKTDIRYRRPVTFLDKVDASIWVSKISKVRFTVTAEMFVDGEESIRATQSGCFVDLKSKRPIVVPEPLVQMFDEAG